MWATGAATMAAPATMLKTACLPIVAAQPQSRCEGQVGGKLRQNKLARAAWAAQSGGEGSSRTNSPARAVMGAGRWQAAHSRCFDLGGNGTSQPEGPAAEEDCRKGGAKTGAAFPRVGPTNDLRLRVLVNIPRACSVPVKNSFFRKDCTGHKV